MCRLSYHSGIAIPVRYEREPGHPGLDDLRGHIGSTLRRRRELHRLTQTQFAKRAGVSQATVARIERGDRAPSVELLERLFATLGCQVRLQLEPLGRRVDEAITALEELPIGKRIAASGVPSLAVDLDPIPHLSVAPPPRSCRVRRCRSTRSRSPWPGGTATSS